ncbi:MAG: FecR family protein [Pseudomonadota bacterium]|nr:FecR family protein [Pseudomonadota bacterium]
MKRTYVGILVTSLLVFSPMTAYADKIVGSFAVVKGKVTIKDKKGVANPAKVGGKVRESDTIAAEKDSRAKLVMVDKNELNISPETEIRLDKYTYEPEKNEKSVLINVFYGKVRSQVNQKYDGKESTFHVKTPAAVAGVRGTDFLAGFNASTKESQFVTFKGLVEVGQSGPGNSIVNSVSVAPGQSTTSVGNNPPAPPAAVPKSELANMEKESSADKSGGKPDTRTPADSGEKKEEKKDKKDEVKEEKREAKEEKREAKQEARNGDGPNGPPVSGDSLREPASDGNAPPVVGGTEGGYSGGDLAALPPPPPPAPDMPMIDPGMMLPPPMPTVGYLPPPCDYCNGVIANGKTTVFINVTSGP